MHGETKLMAEIKPRKLRPPPSLQVLVERWGGFGFIPTKELDRYAAEVERWKKDVRYGEAEE